SARARRVWRCALRAAQAMFRQTLPLAPFEPRRALLEEGGHALAEVLGSSRNGLELRLTLELLLQRRGLSVVQEALGERDPAGGKGGELGGEGRGACGEAVSLYDLGDEPPRVGFGRTELASGGAPCERAR